MAFKRIIKRSSRRESEEPEVKWNTLDGILSVLILVALLVGIYFGTAFILKKIDESTFLNISSINNLSFSILYGIQVFLMVGVVWFFAIYWRGAVLKDLGIRYYSIIKTLWYTFIALIAIFVFSFLYVLVMDMVFGIESSPSKIEELVRNRSISNTILLIVTAVVAPFCEELYFRGFLYSAFKKNLGVNMALFLSSLLFALAHLEIYSFIPIMVIGWVLAYIYEKTRSLLPVIFLHATYNLISILILLGQIDMVRMY